MRQGLAVAQVTGRDFLRQPAAALLLLGLTAAILLVPFLTAFKLGDSLRSARDSVLATYLLGGLALGGLAGITALGSRAPLGARLAMLSKPATRTVVFLGQAAGLAAALVPALAAGALASLAALRMADPAHLPSPHMPGAAFAAPLLALAVAALAHSRGRAAFGTALTVALPAALALALVAPATGALPGSVASIPWTLTPALLLAGLAAVIMMGLALGATAAGGGFAAALTGLAALALGLALPAWNAPAALRALVPDWTLFWGADLLSDAGAIPWGYVACAAAYAAVYVAGVLGLGSVAFAWREPAGGAP